MTWTDEDVPGGPRDLVGYGPNPPRVRWPEEARVVISLVLNYEEGAEYAVVAGDHRNEGFTEYNGEGLNPRYRDLAAESVYEYGSRAGVWRLLRLFDRYELKVTCFACAVALERQPAVAEWLVHAGHEVCSHGWRWSEYWLMTREQEKEEMARAIASIQRLTGQRPLGWYSRYGPSVNTRDLLVEEGGFVYDSDAYNDDLPYFVTVRGKRHLVIPYTKTYNDVRFVLPQGYGRPADFVETCRRGLDYLWEEGETHPRLISIGLHARVMGQAARAAALRDFVEYALHKPGVKFMRRLDIARWWLAHCQEFAP
jgi:peptidoglycan/xylan/chitin deacetylase (PgdA/CDA1 family)